MIAAPRCAGSFFFAGGMPWKARAHAESPAPAAGFFYAGSARCGVFLRASCHAAALRRRIFPPQRDFWQRASALRFAGVFSWSVRAHFASLVQFGAAGAFPRLRWRDFVERASARGKSGTSCRIFYAGSARCGVFLRASCPLHYSAGFFRPSAILGSVRAYFVSLARFRAKCERILLFRRDLGQRERFHGFAGAISVFKSAFAVCPERIHAVARGGLSSVCCCIFAALVIASPCFEDNDTRTFC